MTGCLFDLKHDHTEQHEVSAANPKVVAEMMTRMEALTATIWSAEGGHSNDEECKIFDLEHCKYSFTSPPPPQLDFRGDS